MKRTPTPMASRGRRIAVRQRVELSAAQMEQRRNAAAKSTGPRTPEGKARSSRNAWKHGLDSAAARVSFATSGAQSMAALFGKPCQVTCPMHPDNPNVQSPCSLVLDGLTRAGSNCLDKTVYVNALAALADAMENNEMGGMHALLAAEGAAAVQMIHELRREISNNGFLLRVPLTLRDSEGNTTVAREDDGTIIAGDFKANPLVPMLIHSLDKMGISLPEMLATPQAQNRAKTGEKAADSFQSLIGNIMNRAGGGNTLPPPADGAA